MVSQVFNMDFNLNADMVIPTGYQLLLRLPFYDTGLVSDITAVVCKINYAVVPCIPFKGLDQILMSVQTTLAFGATIQNYVRIEGLKWPRYSMPNGLVYVDVFTNANATVKTYTYAALIQPQSNYFEKYSLTLDKTRQGEANTLYTLTFQTRNDIPDGASITLDLPAQYTLLASNPPITISMPDFISATTGTLSYFYSSARIVIQNVGSYPKLTDFRILIGGVKNPSTTLVLSTWSISLLLNSYLVEQKTNFASFSLNSAVVPGTITLNSISTFPDNQYLYGDHSFSFTPRTSLKEGAIISITFPSQYRILPSQPVCLISGQLNSFDTCTTSLNTISVKLNSQFTAGTINLQIKDIINPVKGETDKFIIQTSYDSQIIDSVDTSTNAGKTIFITESPTLLFMTTFSYDPQNEGEISTYTFGFNPRITLTEIMQIIIQFPDTFDANLGNKVQCYPIKNLKGNIVCSISDRTITVKGFGEIKVTDDDPIVIEIRGVVNPNVVINSDSGTINLGVQYTGATSFLSFVQQAGVVETVDAPGWTFFQGLTSSNTFSRFTSDYLFNFTVFDPIPNADSGGLVVIDLPTQFSPTDGAITCSVGQITTYGSPSCSIINNRIYVSGNQQYYSGHLDLTISNLLNPLDQVESSYFYIKTYDGFKKKIIERSFYNLDPFFFDYLYAGPLIKVNNDQPLTIEAGTQTVDLIIELDRIAALDIIIKPSSLSGISFIPYQVPVYIGQKTATIRVSVSENFLAGDYLIQWKILKDQIPPFYSPIRPTKLTITKNRGILISVQALNDVPFGGTSLPCKFSVVNAPDSGFQININTKFSYAGIALDKNIIYFSSGVNENFFSVLFTDPIKAAQENLATGQIEVSITGDNSAVYMLNAITLYFNIIQEDISPPNILSMKLDNVDQYSVGVTIKVDDVVACYYMIALKGTETPPISEVKNQGPPQVLTTQSRYGYVFIGSSGTATITFDGLQPSTEYVIFAFAEDRGSNINGDPSILNFATAGSLLSSRQIQSRRVRTVLQQAGSE